MTLKRTYEVSESEIQRNVFELRQALESGRNERKTKQKVAHF